MTSASRPATRALPGAKVLIEDRDERTLPGQKTGYWYLTPKDIPQTRPTYEPNGALLLRPGEEDGRALVLAGFDDVWFPLSEAASLVYSPLRVIAEGGSATFVESGLPQRAWPGQVFQVQAAMPLPRARVAEVYGAAAGLRARPEKKTVQVLVKKQ
jgi:hypothetical protein